MVGEELPATDRHRDGRDGVPDHTQPNLVAWLTDHAVTNEEQLDRFGAWCDRYESCALHGRDAVALWESLLERAREGSLLASGLGEGQTVGYGPLLRGSYDAMLRPPRWPALATAIQRALDGDAADFVTAFSDEPTEPYGNVQGLIQSHDFYTPVPDPDGILAIEAELRRTAPRIGWVAVRAELGRGYGVPEGPAYRRASLDAEDLGPVLVAIGELDSLTPNRGAERFVGELRAGRALRHGDGHAAFMHGNTCLGSHATAYLVDGVVPEEGAYCPTELVGGWLVVPPEP